MVVVPSPRSQKRLVMVPRELSVKLTVKGKKPTVGLAPKLAVGTSAPEPVTTLVLPPPLLVKTTRLVELAVFVGAKLTSTKVF